VVDQPSGAAAAAGPASEADAVEVRGAPLVRHRRQLLVQLPECGHLQLRIQRRQQRPVRRLQIDRVYNCELTTQG